MNEITKVVLENEMDLILAHKQSMRLAELTGLSLAAQTTFATAVSEVSRTAIGEEYSACLTLCISDKKETQKFLVAILEDQRTGFSETEEGYGYASRLVANIKSSVTEEGTRIELNYRLPPYTRIDDNLLEKWRISLNNDPAVSPYEEIKRKNRQLVEMAEKLQASEQQYITLTDSLPLMIITLTQEGKIIYANEWLSRFTGQSVDTINSTKWSNIIHPDDYAAFCESWKYETGGTAALASPERRILEAASGQYRWHTGIATPIADEAGSFKCWNIFMVDIHAHKMVEETLKDNHELKEIKQQLEEQLKQLNQSNRQLEQFAYVASHDLQEPLRKIGFYGDFLTVKYRNTLPDEGILWFDNMIKASQKMRILIKDILAYSTISKDKQAIKEVDLNDIAAQAILELEVAIRAQDASISYQDLPVLAGNETQLKQLFENLLSNSLKYAEEGKQPVIRIYSTVNQEEAFLYFEDNGIGFEPLFLDKMFDLFQRLHTKDKYGGTGIGLAICKKIVTMHQGTITAVSEPGKGATFRISLPLKQKESVILSEL